MEIHAVSYTFTAASFTGYHQGELGFLFFTIFPHLTVYNDKSYPSHHKVKQFFLSQTSCMSNAVT